MATWECRECTALYAPGAPACPQCQANDPIQETEQLQRELETMPKITVHGGPSNADTGEGMPEAVVPDSETEAPPAEAPAVEEKPEPVADGPKPRAARKTSRS
ncbi:hypothetical protein ACFWIW_10690 [Amycolatopsis sp. NPDC058340]|uniref:hypothetical protein n=1 Tax=Amycolatopsis sp. NPDC058340 TaxID=3346453 RepID=UPI003660C8E2